MYSGVPIVTPLCVRFSGCCIAGQNARQAEVGDLDLALARQQDVLRLDVAVDDAQFAGALQGGGDLPHDAQGQQQVGRPLLAA